MTFSQIYLFAKKILKENNIYDSAFEAMCLMNYYFGFDRIKLISQGNEKPDEHKEKEFIESVKKRAGGYPLQYIVGKWTFMDSEFFVGEGVLIPRDDTEQVVRTCADSLKNNVSPIIIDLCSGSGAIAITLAKLFPTAKVYALELFDKAFSYLEKNIEHNKVQNVIKVKADIFTAYTDFDDEFFDAIISNPPYIETDTIKTLQKEVQKEPITALDGGSDGLDFYRVISEKWLSKLKVGGCVSLEIGETQSEQVTDMFLNRGICDLRTMKDIQNLDRVIFGTKK